MGMWITFARWARRFANWCEPPAPPPPPPVQAPVVTLVVPIDDLFDRAVRLVRNIEERAAPGTGGEYKRHQVYAALLKAFPDVSHRRIAVVIEAAVETYKGTNS